MGSPLSKKYKCGTEQIHTRGLSFPDQPGVSGLMETQVMMTSLQCSQQVFVAQQYGILQEIQTENQISKLRAIKADREDVSQCMEVALSTCCEVQDLKQQFSELVETVNRQAEVHHVENHQSQDHQANYRQSHREEDRANDQQAQDHQCEDSQFEDQQAERQIDSQEIILAVAQENLQQRSVDTEALQTLSKQVEGVKVTLSKQVEGVKVQLDNINISKRATQLDIDTLEGKCDNIQKIITEKADVSDVAELKQTVEELKMAMNVLKEQDDNRTKEIHCLTKLTTDCQANVSKISAGVLQQQENISQLTSTQAETDRLIKNLGKVVERNCQEGEEIKSRVQRLEESQDKASNNIASLAATVNLFVTAVDNRGREGIRNYNNTLWCQNQSSMDVSISD